MLEHHQLLGASDHHIHLITPSSATVKYLPSHVVDKLTLLSSSLEGVEEAEKSMPCSPHLVVAILVFATKKSAADATGKSIRFKLCDVTG